MTIVDGLIKYAKFILCYTSIDVTQLVYVWIREIYADHGIPEKIILDRDKLFITKFTERL